MTSASGLPPIYVVYDHPRDYPRSFVCRVWYGERICGGTPHMIAATIEEIRDALQSLGLVNMGRFAEDDPAIREVWI